MGIGICGAGIFGLEMMNRIKEKNERIKRDQKIREMNELKRRCDENAEYIKSILNNEKNDECEINEEFELRVKEKCKDIKIELEQILRDKSVNNKEKYMYIRKLVSDIENEVVDHYLSNKMENNEKIINDKISTSKCTIESHLNEILLYFSEIENDISQYKNTHLDNIKVKINKLISEVNRIKTENESSATIYYNKIKNLIEEGETHIKDIDSKMPKDLSTVKQDIKERMVKLRFMVSEYLRHHRSKSENYEFINQYLEKCSLILNKMRTTNSDDNFKNKEADREKEDIDKIMVQIKQEILKVNDEIDDNNLIFERYNNLNSNNTLELNEYLAKLESLYVKMESISLTGGDISEKLQEFITYVGDENELISSICKDLLTNEYTSSNVITVKSIKDNFDK